MELSISKLQLSTQEHDSFKSGRFHFDTTVTYLEQRPFTFDLAGAIILLDRLLREDDFDPGFDEGKFYRDVGINLGIECEVSFESDCSWKSTEVYEALMALVGHFLEEDRHVERFEIKITFANQPQRETMRLNCDVNRGDQKGTITWISLSGHAHDLAFAMSRSTDRHQQRLLTSDVRNLIDLWKQKYHRLFHAPVITRVFDPITARGNKGKLSFLVERLPDPRAPAKKIYYGDIETLLELAFQVVDEHYQSIWYPTAITIAYHPTKPDHCDLAHISINNVRNSGTSGMLSNTSFSLGNETSGTS